MFFKDLNFFKRVIFVFSPIPGILSKDEFKSLIASFISVKCYGKSMSLISHLLYKP